MGKLTFTGKKKERMRNERRKKRRKEEGRKKKGRKERRKEGRKEFKEKKIFFKLKKLVKRLRGKRGLCKCHKTNGADLLVEENDLFL